MLVFPNPTKDKVNIHRVDLFGYYTVEITRLNGQNVKKISKKGKFEIDVSGLAKGVYLLRFISNGSVETHKLVIE